MNERAAIPVDLPCAQPTISYWQNHPSDIADHQTTERLPESPDLIIIGSGISGSFIAYRALLQRPTAQVVLLEARQACSGATGRNGGHTKAASYRSFLDHERDHGTAEAVKIARMELANIDATHAFAREHGIECASHECATVDIVYSQSQYDIGKSAITRMRAVMGEDRAAQYQIFDAGETETRFLTKGAVGSFQYDAGSISAYDFAIGVLKIALKAGLNFQTHTAALAVERSASAWTVATTRGSITAPQVVVATNGYTAKLLPQLQGLVVPLQGQVAAQRSGLGLPTLSSTYSFIYEAGYEYMISRPPGVLNAGDIIIGGGIHKLTDSGASRYSNTDDGTLEPLITEYLRGCPKTSFGPNWGNDHSQGRIKQEWSGIMGATADGLPYVGEMPGMSGVWVSAGFNGHGMVLCLKAAEALVDMMIGNHAMQTRSKHWFPQSMVITYERLQHKFVGRKDLRAPGEAQFGERTHSSLPSS